MKKISDRMMRLAREMVSIAATDWSEAEADEFLDRVNPGIRRRLLLEQLSGGGDRIALDTDDGYQVRQKISAIRAVRLATGFDLRNAKEFVESTEEGRMCHWTGGVLPDTVSAEARQRLAQEERNTGYRLV